MGTYVMYVWHPGTRTESGIRIGDPLKAVVKRHARLRCGVRNRDSEYAAYPYCKGRVGDNYVWFGQDPIRSVTIADTPMAEPTRLHLARFREACRGYHRLVGHSNKGIPFDKPERPASQQRRPLGIRRGLVVAGGGSLFIYGAVTVLVASAWGPGNSDPLVGTGPELIPWYGFPAVGTLAALLAIILHQQLRTAICALSVAVLTLVAWTVGLYFVF